MQELDFSVPRPSSPVRGTPRACEGGEGSECLALFLQLLEDVIQAELDKTVQSVCDLFYYSRSLKEQASLGIRLFRTSLGINQAKEKVRDCVVRYARSFNRLGLSFTIILSCQSLWWLSSHGKYTFIRVGLLLKTHTHMWLFF